MDEKRYVAIVQKIRPDGRHGPYAKATCDTLPGITITFLLAPPVWNEKRYPDEGNYVVLSGLTKKRAGWRADFGRFLEPSDEQPCISNQK
jgi:hypothetical protein